MRNHSSNIDSLASLIGYIRVKEFILEEWLIVQEPKYRVLAYPTQLSDNGQNCVHCTGFTLKHRCRLKLAFYFCPESLQAILDFANIIGRRFAFINITT